MSILLITIICVFLATTYLAFYLIRLNYNKPQMTGRSRMIIYSGEPIISRSQIEVCRTGGNAINNSPYRTISSLRSQLGDINTLNRIGSNPSENSDLDILYNISKDNLPKENNVKKEEKKDNLEEKKSFTIFDRLKKIEESEDN